MIIIESLNQVAKEKYLTFSKLIELVKDNMN